jgi:signal peptide peptidase SppA
MDSGDRSCGLGSFALPRLAARIFSTPLMIQPEKLDAILTAVGPRLMGGAAPRFTESDLRVGPTNMRIADNGIAIIPVLGTLVMNAGGVHPASGITSYEQIESAFDVALADSSVRAILLEIDSPGGEVSGVFDLVDKIRAARGTKPIWAISNEMALSAAYAIASAADRVVLPRTAHVGSVGVVAAHVDQSGWDKEMGLAYSYIFAGEKKIDGNPHQPLSDRARADIQASVNSAMDIFVATVALGRGMSEEAVRATQAGIFNGAAAIESGFADSVMSFRETVAALGDHAATSHSRFQIVRVPGGTAQVARAPSRAAVPMPGDPAGPHPGKSEEAMTDATKPEAEAKLSTEAEPAGAEKTAESKEAENVVDLEKVRAEARETAISDVSCIVDLCALAGLPEMAKEFIDKGLSADEARKRLLAARADATDKADVASRHNGGAFGDASNNYGWDRAFARATGRHTS